MTTSPSGPRVLACGLATLDVVQTVGHVPSANEKLVAQGLLVGAGGPAANAAVTAVALGVPTRLVTRIGGAALGRVVTADLVARGVEVIDRAGPDDAPAVSTVLVTRATGERAVVSVNATRGGGTRPPDTAGSSDRDATVSAFDGVAAVLVDGHHLDLALDVARTARGRGVPVLLDAGSWKPGLEALLGLVDIALLSEDFRVPE
ncbi:PfkB family carbohydrate kinase, partial [Actinotalea sp.]|uniref:PfkB family carbohydrate kinase n=1 Tax=Actinotalea sp. TaxID=1872145 RepID=UPI002CB8EC38